MASNITVITRLPNCFYQYDDHYTLVVAPIAKLLWDSLHNAYVNNSWTQVFSLCDQLARLSKESCIAANYLHQVRSLLNEHAIVGAPVSNDELSVKIPYGLGVEFCKISSIMRAKDSHFLYGVLCKTP
ncbi:hypothetical protein PVK06_046465 [Gossypium arboreum]|uniref:Uncharacterized protein n=1 Tax=Gossypium arboreum TaxID=29729 RepID=A0ABR0MCL6_GOSAR|nr:hypothetical protein PVK06_046465 [Gossypium arboreum]